MSLIEVSNLTFSYDTNHENIFENTSFRIDTDWKLGFIGRNGRGKTTFLKLLMGEYEYSGTITASVDFEYFPPDPGDASRSALSAIRGIIAHFDEWETEMDTLVADGSDAAMERYAEIFELYSAHDGYVIDELITAEAGRIGVPADVLLRPFDTLSGGEKIKLMLAGLFLKKNSFLLIDEPTNHLDYDGRRAVAEYLRSKKGFILVSHDRMLLDSAVDHVLSINRSTIEVQKGNFSSWQENRRMRDEFELAQNEKLKKDIQRLNEASRRTAGWSDDIESSKYGGRNSGLRPDRGFIGHRAAKMMKRAKSIENRREKAVGEKESLLKDLEKADPLSLTVLTPAKKRIMEVDSLTVDYGEGPLFKPLTFTVSEGERISLRGRNGSGKTSILRLILGEDVPHEGHLRVSPGTVISPVRQDTSFLAGNLRDFARSFELDESLFLTILRKLDFSRNQFEKDMAELSGGQKKKVLVAASLATPAHLFVWDEPLNFIDVISREQIEELILNYEPTMIFVEHDMVFCDKIATSSIDLG